MSHELHFVDCAEFDSQDGQAHAGSSAWKAHVARINHRRRLEKRQQTLRLQPSTLLIQSMPLVVCKLVFPLLTLARSTWF